MSAHRLGFEVNHFLRTKLSFHAVDTESFMKKPKGLAPPWTHHRDGVASLQGTDSDEEGPRGPSKRGRLDPGL